MLGVRLFMACQNSWLELGVTAGLGGGAFTILRHKYTTTTFCQFFIILSILLYIRVFINDHLFFVPIYCNEFRLDIHSCIQIGYIKT